MNMLSKRLEKILEAAKAWPTEKQDAAAAVLEHMHALDTGDYALNNDERADLEAALGEARRGEFASVAEVAAVFTRDGA
jgi:hypothetical protein